MQVNAAKVILLTPDLRQKYEAGGLSAIDEAELAEHGIQVLVAHLCSVERATCAPDSYTTWLAGRVSAHSCGCMCCVHMCTIHVVTFLFGATTFRQESASQAHAGGCVSNRLCHSRFAGHVSEGVH